MDQGAVASSSSSQRGAATTVRTEDSAVTIGTNDAHIAVGGVRAAETAQPMGSVVLGANK